MTPESKVCSKCGIEKPMEEFHKQRGCAFGRRPDCKACCVRRAQKWADDNPERVKANHARHQRDNAERLSRESREYREAHKEQLSRYHKENHKKNRTRNLLRSRAWHHANKSRVRELSRVWVALNKDARDRYYKEWITHNPEHKRAASNNFKRREQGAQGTCTPDQWIARLEYYGWRCYLCRAELTSKTLHMEHRIPVGRGGSHWPANLAPACPTCNFKKRLMTETEYRATFLAL